MKRTLHLILTAATLTFVSAGCANRYVIRLSNGNEITTRNRPKLDEKNQVYRYKNSDGKEAFVPAVRVSSIESQ